MKTIIYELRVNGQKLAIKNQKELAAAVKQVKKETENADFGSAKYKELNKDLGALKEIQKDLRADTRDLGRAFKISADDGRESYYALQAELSNLKREYKQLSRAERDAADGRDLQKKIRGISKELKDLDSGLGDNFRNVGNYAEGVSQALQGSIGGLAAGLGAGGALVAGIEIVGEGLRVVRDLSKEIVAVEGKIRQVTQLEGEALGSATTRVQALAKTFQKAPEEIVEAANNAAKGFGVDFETALDELEKGFLSGADNGGQLLQKFEEYPTVLDNAGFSIQEFTKLATQEVRGGIYDDKLIDTLKEADLSLKELTATQKKALAPLGEDFVDDFGAALREGALETQDAIFLISKRAKELGLDLQDTQAITADVFKGAGEDAGGFEKVITNVYEALNLETEDLIDTQNEYVRRQQEALSANERFAEAQRELAESLGGVDGKLENVGTRLKAVALEGLAAVINRGKEFFAIFRPLGDALVRAGKALGIVDGAGKATARTLAVFNAAADATDFIIGLIVKSTTNLIDGFTDAAEAVGGFLDKIGAIDVFNNVAKGIGVVARRIGIIGDNSKKVADEVEKTNKKLEDNANKLKKGYEDLKNQSDETTTSSEDLKKTLDDLGDIADKTAKTGIAGLEARVAELNTRLLEAPDGESYVRISQRIEDLQGKIQRTKKEYEDLLEQAKIDRVTEIFRSSSPAETIESGAGDRSTVDLGKTLLDELTADEEAAAERQKEQDDLLREYKQDNIEKLYEFKQQKREQELEKQEAAAERELEIQREKEERKEEIIQAGVDFAFSALESIADFALQAQQDEIDERRDTALNGLDEEFEERRALAEGDAEAQAAIEQEFALRKQQIEEQAARESKKLAIKQAKINTALAIGNALATVQPFIPAGLAAAALAALKGGFEVAAIQSQQFAEGGFTGRGIGAPDSSGFRPVGVVHEDEYVVPKKVLYSSRGKAMVENLEKIRVGMGYRSNKRRSFAEGGFTSFSRSQDNSQSTTVVNATVDLSDNDIERIAGAVEAGAQRGSTDGSRRGFREAQTQERRNVSLSKRLTN